MLYPQPNGYSIATGDCGAVPVTPAVTPLNAAPGGTASATVPLALLPLQVVTPAGVPMSGATVKLKTVSGGCAGDTYTMPATDAYGFTRTSVPYGTYSYTVTSALGIVTAPTSVTVAATTSSVVTLTKVVKRLDDHPQRLPPPASGGDVVMSTRVHPKPRAGPSAVRPPRPPPGVAGPPATRG